MYIFIVLLGKNLGFLETDSYLDHDHKNNLCVTVLHNPNFFLCMNYFVAHERNA